MQNGKFVMGRDFISILLWACCSTALAQPVNVIKAADLYAEYISNPLVADAKYEGHRVIISGTVINTNFLDEGVAHLRSINLAGDSSNKTTESVQVCFTESCSSVRRPTISDKAFKKIKEGDFISAICNVEPVFFSGTNKSGLVIVMFSKCELPALSVASRGKPN